MDTSKCDIKSVSKAKLLEGHNRRENLRIIQIPEEKSRSDNWQRNFEDFKQSLENVLEVAKEVGALVETSYISIAHKLHRKNSSSRPMVVRFCTQVSKEELLRKKKET